MTEPVWEEYEVEVEEAPAAPVVKKEVPKPAAGGVVKPKTKQASIMGFFGKKT